MVIIDVYQGCDGDQERMAYLALPAPPPAVTEMEAEPIRVPAGLGVPVIEEGEVASASEHMKQRRLRKLRQEGRMVIFKEAQEPHRVSSLIADQSFRFAQQRAINARIKANEAALTRSRSEANAAVINQLQQRLSAAETAQEAEQSGRLGAVLALQSAQARYDEKDGELRLAQIEAKVATDELAVLRQSTNQLQELVEQRDRQLMVVAADSRNQQEALQQQLQVQTQLYQQRITDIRTELERSAVARTQATELESQSLVARERDMQAMVRGLENQMEQMVADHQRQIAEYSDAIESMRQEVATDKAVAIRQIQEYVGMVQQMGSELNDERLKSDLLVEEREAARRLLMEEREKRSTEMTQAGIPTTVSEAVSGGLQFQPPLPPRPVDPQRATDTSIPTDLYMGPNISTDTGGGFPDRPFIAGGVVEPPELGTLTNENRHVRVTQDDLRFGFVEMNTRTTIPQKEFSENLHERTFTYQNIATSTGADSRRLLIPLHEAGTALKAHLNKTADAAFRYTITGLTAVVNVVARHGKQFGVGIADPNTRGEAPLGAPIAWEFRMLHTDTTSTLEGFTVPHAYGSRVHGERTYLLDPECFLWYHDSATDGQTANVCVKNCSIRCAVAGRMDHISSGNVKNGSEQGGNPLREDERNWLGARAIDPSLLGVVFFNADSSNDIVVASVTLTFQYIEGWPSSLLVPIDEKTMKLKAKYSTACMKPPNPETWKDGKYWPVPLDQRYALGEDSLWGRRPYTRFMGMETQRGVPCLVKGCYTLKKRKKTTTRKRKATTYKKRKSKKSVDVYTRMKRVRAAKKRKASGRTKKYAKKKCRK